MFVCVCVCLCLSLCVCVCVCVCVSNRGDENGRRDFNALNWCRSQTPALDPTSDPLNHFPPACCFLLSIIYLTLRLCLASSYSSSISVISILLSKLCSKERKLIPRLKIERWFKHDTWPCQRALIQVKTSKVWSQQIVFSFNMQQTTTPFLNSCKQWNYLTPMISELKCSHHRQFGIEKLIATTVFKLILKWKLCNSNYRWFLAVIIHPYPSSDHQVNLLTIQSVSQSLEWFRQQVIGEPWFIP